MSRGKHRKMAATFTRPPRKDLEAFASIMAATVGPVLQRMTDALRLIAALGIPLPDPARPNCKPRKARRIHRRRARARGQQPSLVWIDVEPRDWTEVAG